MFVQTAFQAAARGFTRFTNTHFVMVGGSAKVSCLCSWFRWAQRIAGRPASAIIIVHVRGTQKLFCQAQPNTGFRVLKKAAGVQIVADIWILRRYIKTTTALHTVHIPASVNHSYELPPLFFGRPTLGQCSSYIAESIDIMMMSRYCKTRSISERSVPTTRATVPAGLSKGITSR